MKILLFSDLHISDRISLAGGNTRDENGERRSIRDTRQAFYWLANEAISHSVDMVVFAGDLFDRSRPSPDEYQVALEGMDRLADIAPVFAIPGNHDLTSGRNANATDPLAYFKRIHWHKTPGKQSFFNGALNVFSLPYPPAKAFVDGSKEQINAASSLGLNAILDSMAAQARQSKPSEFNLLVAHITFAGSAYSEGRTASMTDVQVSTQQLDAFDFVAAGHIHKDQMIGGWDHAEYLGTVDRWQFDDEKNTPGATLIEFNRGSLIKRTRLEYPNARQFRTLSFVEFPAFDLPEDDSERARLFLRAVGRTGSLEDHDRVTDAVRAMANAGVGAARNDVQFFKRDVEEIPVLGDDSIAGLFEAFNNARKDAIPEFKRDETLAVVNQLIKDVQA
jgi:exonuclease SbcD